MIGWRHVVIAIILILAIFGSWYWRSRRNVELYGGVKPYMQKLSKLHAATAGALHGAVQLPLDFKDMEQLSQTAQDIFGVFGNSPITRNPAFQSLATGQIRYAVFLESSWDSGRIIQAKQAFIALTNTCNSCHRQLAKQNVPNVVFKP